MDNNQLTVINQDAKIALAKTKDLLSVTDKILANYTSKELLNSFENFRFFPSLGHSSDVSSVAITTDGKYIVSGSLDETIKLWDISSGKEIRSFEGHSSDVSSVAITPDGKYIVSGSYDETIKLWDIKLWDIQSGEEIISFEGHSNVNSVAITHDGKYIVSGGSDNTIKLWDIKSGKEIRNFKGHNRSIDSVAITHDGKYIVSAGGDKTIKIWDISSGKEIRSFEGHSRGVSSAVITPDGKYIVSGSWDKTIKLWDIRSGKLLYSYVAFFDGEWLSWNSNNEYNCSDGAYKYFCFIDDSNGIGEVLPQDHLVYKAKKKEKLLGEYKVCETVKTPMDNETIINYSTIEEE